MIPPIQVLYQRLLTDWEPEGWEFTAEEIAYLEQITGPDDLLNYRSGNTATQALAYDCALALGLSKHDAMSAAGDH